MTLRAYFVNICYGRVDLGMASCRRCRWWYVDFVAVDGASVLLVVPLPVSMCVLCSSVCCFVGFFGVLAVHYWPHVLLEVARGEWTYGGAV
jgi:hypothetical protein